MKTLLAALFAALLALTAAMVASRPREGKPGKVPLVWVTDKNPTRDAQIEVFERNHPDLDLFIDPGNTDTQKVIVQSQAGVGPDVFDYWGEAAKNAYVQSGIAWDLTDALLSHEMDFRKSIWPLALSWTTTKDGRIYGVPANVGVDAIWIHQDLFEKAGVPLPKPGWTLDDLVKTAEALTVRGKDGHIEQYGLLVDFGGAYREFLPEFGGDLFDEKGLHCTVADEPSVACLNFIHDLLYKYRVAPSPADEQSLTAGGGWGGGAGPQAYFRKKMGAMALGGRWWLVQLRDDVRDHGFKLAAAPPPVGKFSSLGGGGTRAVMINSRSPHREEALQFLLYLLGENYNLLLNDQGDALSGVRKYAYTDRYVHVPDYPTESFHVAFRATLERGVMLRSSPFIDMVQVDASLNRQLDLVKLNQKEPAAAMRDAVDEIDAAIRRNASRDPKLREAFLAAGGKF